MSHFLLRSLWLAVLISGSLSVSLRAQKPSFDVYKARVVTKDGNRFRGTLEDITDTYLYLGNERSRHRIGAVPLGSIRKVVISRASKKSAFITGAIIGGLVTGYLANQSLQRNQTSSPVSYGLTLTFAAAGGAAGGLLLGSAIGNLKSRVIRPLDLNNPERSLFRQLEPFSVGYQQDFIKRLPKND